jgi:hypothetical protein
LVEDAPVRVPDAIEPIVAYRMWVYLLGYERAELRPINSSAGGEATGRGGWHGAESGWVVASCLRGSHLPEHTAPAESCTCGFYAVPTLRVLLEGSLLADCVERVSRTTELGIASGVVLGRVKLAGTVVEHEYAYRAGRARIRELIPISGTERTVRRLGARLGLPVGRPVARPLWPGPRGPSAVRMRLKQWVRLDAA